MDVVDRLVVGVALLFWIAAAVKVAELRSASTPASRTLALTLASVATSAMLLTSSIHRLVGELTGVANLAEPLGRTALLAAAFGGQVLLVRLTSGGRATRRVARRVPAFAAALILLWSLFVAAPVDAATMRFTSRFGDDPRVAAYLAVSLAYLVLLALVRRGRLADRHLTLRYQRPAMMVFGLLSVSAGLWVMSMLGAPGEMLALVIAMVAGVVVALAISSFWKISIHTACVGTVTVLGMLVHPALAVLAPLVVATAWARVALRDHTVAQVVVAAAVGAGVAAAALIITGPLWLP